MTTYRTFIAIELPPQIRHRLKQHIDKIRVALPDVRASWSREDNLHLTLKFLGDVPLARIQDLSGACDEAAGSTDSFELEIGGGGTFPPHGKPKVLWIGVQDKTVAPEMTNQRSALISLHTAIEDACARRDFAADTRAYHPHLTLARLRETRNSRSLAEYHRAMTLAPDTFRVSELVLFRSELSSKGSTHTALSRHQFRDVS